MFSRKKYLLNLARICLNDDQIRNGAALPGDERQAQKQMPVNLIPLDLNRKLALRKLTTRPEVAGFALAGLQLFDARGNRDRRLEIPIGFAPGVADGRLI